MGAFYVFLLPKCPGWSLQYKVESKWWEWTLLSCSWFKGKSIHPFTIKYDVSCGFFIDCHLSSCCLTTSTPKLLKVFIMKGCWILSNIFSMSTEMILCFFFLYSVDMLYYINWFLDVKPTLHSWNKSHLVYNLFCMLLDSVS